MSWIIEKLDKLFAWNDRIQRSAVPYEVWKDVPADKIREVQDAYIKAKREQFKAEQEAKKNSLYSRHRYTYDYDDDKYI